MKAVDDRKFMRRALQLAKRAQGLTSPNPLVGAVLVKSGRIIGQGWHHRAGQPHAEIEALHDAARHGANPGGATLYVTLEPCCTQGRTPPCTRAILEAGIRRVVVGAIDPNPQHAGRGLDLLRRAGLKVDQGVLAEESARLNETFNHWILRRTPFVTVKAAMTLDGKIATPTGESKWITGERARAKAMRLRLRADAILVGVNTVLADDPSLTLRNQAPGTTAQKKLRRIILDARGRTPLNAKVVSDAFARQTTVIVTRAAPARRVAALRRHVNVLVAPAGKTATPGGRPTIDLDWLMKRLGSQNVTHLLVEGGGEAQAAFLFQNLAHRIVFFYAPKILGGRNALQAVSGKGAASIGDALALSEIEWRHLDGDLMLRAKVESSRRFRVPDEMPGDAG